MTTGALQPPGAAQPARAERAPPGSNRLSQQCRGRLRVLQIGSHDPLLAAHDRGGGQPRHQREDRGRDAARRLEDPLERALADLAFPAQRQSALQTSNQRGEFLVIPPGRNAIDGSRDAEPPAADKPLVLPYFEVEEWNE